jgi:hypothetical protein
MSNPFRSIAPSGLLLLSPCTASFASVAYSDPPERVARLSHVQGEVSYSPAGEDDWFGVVRNRPLTRGDRLWTDRDARAEFQVGSAAIRMGSSTGVEILDLDDRIAQIRMTQDTLNLSVRRMYRGQIIEIATPTLAFTADRPGRYRVDVDVDVDVDRRLARSASLRYRSRDKDQRSEGDAQKQTDAAERQQAERKCQLELQQKRQAECEREAIRLNQGVSKCKIGTRQQENLRQHGQGQDPQVKTGLSGDLLASDCSGYLCRSDATT